MRKLFVSIAFTVAALASQANARPHPNPDAYIDVAAQPAYPESAARVRHSSAHALRRSRSRRYIPARHVDRKPPRRAEEAHKRPPEAGPVEGAIKALGDAADASAAALGALLGIPGGWEDGIATSVPRYLGLVADRAYLVATSCPGYTMERQGPAVAIGRLNPTFAERLAGAIRAARADGIDACIFSAYRPPAYGIGGFRDKFESAHSYGLAVDLGGLDGPGSRTAVRFHKLAAAYGVYGVYGPYSRSEFNHFQPTRWLLVADEAPLRRTITAAGPRDLERMWRVGDAIISPPGLAERSFARRQHRYGAERYAHHRRHERRRYARA